MSDPADARALYRAAFQEFAAGRVEAAIAGYRKALEADPEYALAWNGLSIAYRNQGALDEAIEAALRLVEIEPDDPLSHTNLSILYQQKGMIAEAEDAAARASQLQAATGSS
ncbi:MAG: tetratricopeptide repeat protein [Myxococcota bacterium]|nr:tetratricopeptide repeat protein [Myxococcota bacterium]